MQQLEVCKWGQHLPPVIGLLPRMVALCAEDVHRLCEVARTRVNLDGSGDSPPFAEWAELYTEPSRVFAKVREAFLADYTGGDADFPLLDVMDLLKSIGEAPESEVKRALSGVTRGELFAAVGQIQSDLSEHCNQLLAECLLGVQAESEEADRHSEILKSPQVQFYFQVWFPCWIQYGVSVPTLFRRAAGGESKALHRLLQLDPFVIQRPEILRRFAGERDKDEARKLDYHFRGGDCRQSMVKVKETLAGLIDKVLREIDDRFRHLDREFPAMKPFRPRVKLREPDIRALFDAAARDLHGLDAIDTDIPDAPEAFQKAIYRARRYFWPKVEEIGLLF